MAEFNSSPFVPATAGEDLSGSQFCAVAPAAGDEVVLPTANGFCLGVLQNEPESGRGATVQISGEAKVIAGATFAVGARLKADASGHALSTTTSTDNVFAIALEAATSVGQRVKVLLVQGSFGA